MFNRQTAQASAGRHRCDVITHRYMFSGDLDAGVPLLRHLMDPHRAGIKLAHVTATLLDATASSLSTFSQDELIVLKDYVVFMRFDTLGALGAKQAAAQEEKLLVYTERFVLQGFFHSNAERNRLLDTDGATGRWAVARDVIMHPLVPTSKGAPATAKAILLNKMAIQFFHAARH